MSSVPLPEIDETARELAQQIADGESGCLQILGGISVGKSTLLRRIGSELTQRGLHPILVAPPPDAPDILSVSLTQIASQIHNGSPTLAQVEGLLRDQNIATADKHQQLNDWLVEGRDQFVVLCDEPADWQKFQDHHPGRWDNLAALYRTLLDTKGLRRVMTGPIPQGRLATREFKVPASSQPESWLQSRTAWGPFLADHALSLWDELGYSLVDVTPLELRLMVGLVALGENPTKLTRRNRRGLAELFWDHCASDSKLNELCDAWSNLALVRQAFLPELLQVIDAPKEDTDTGQLLRRCLLYEDRYSKQLVLHEMLRPHARRSLRPDRRQNAHLDIATRYYLPLFQSVNRPDPSFDPLVYEVEAYYHAASSGEIPGSLRPFFAEQLNLLGRYLSEHERRYAEAAQVFSRAIAWEPKDDYAHHYKAYNLDRLGQEPDEVEARYREAITLRDDHPWWWSRWICFLLTRGRIEEAEAAWSDALDALAYSLEEPESSVFRELHAHVLNLALHFSQLHFVERILNDIPRSVLSQDSHLSACQRRFNALRMAEEGRAVVPLPVLKEGWWNAGPFRLFPTLHSGHQLVRWLAARVNAVSQDTAEVHIAEVPMETCDEPRVMLSALPLDKLAEWSVSSFEPREGDYWEIGVYQRDDNEHCRLVENNDDKFHEIDQQLFALDPDPDRYGFARSTQ